MTTRQYISQIPSDWIGSIPEYVALAAFQRAGKVLDTDFTYQSPLMGGRMDKGGSIIDFLFINPPDLAVNVQGVYYHYELGAETRARDILARESMAGQGITLIFVDEDDLIQDPLGITRDALNYIDKSRLGGGR